MRTLELSPEQLAQLARRVGETSARIETARDAREHAEELREVGVDIERSARRGTRD